MRMTLPLAALPAWAAARGRSLGIVLAAGLFIASPFFTSHGLGTGEAYNYSLAVADCVTQIRAGEFPVLVGQSEYAWNGRIHPLRTAPYLPYGAGLLDLVTFHALGLWTLQNLVIGLSLFGGVLSFYCCLRRAVPELSDRTAAVLAAAYGLAPGLLSTAYAMDLYMTVMTAPWIPVVLGGLARAHRAGSFGALAQTAVGLAACWLAHPPIAMWLTGAAGLAALAILATGRHRGRFLGAAAGAALLFLVLAGYAFVSALTVSSYGSITAPKYVGGILTETRRAFPASLLPVSPEANQLGDFQLGYAYWLVVVAAAGLAVWRRHLLAGVLVATAGFFLLLTLPVPGAQAWLWQALPASAVTLTSQWPMQRFYLLVTALGLFAFGLVWRPPAAPLQGFLRDAAFLAAAVAVLWTGWQAIRFVARGFNIRLDDAQSARVHRPENINLTIISFDRLVPPPWFENGVMDPAMEIRLRAPFDGHVLQANATAPFADTEASGTFRASAANNTILTLAPRLTLQPGRRYRLSFAFRVPPQTLVLQLLGRTFFREYPLPAAGGPEGFGMQPGNSRSLFLWTTSSEPEEVELRLVAASTAGLDQMPFADFTLETTTVDRLPFVIESFVPLRLRVRAEAAGYLEVPRMFVRGYAATVNGQPVHVQASPDGLVLLPVPAGASRVEVRYRGPWLLRAWFWTTLAGWLAMGVWRVAPGWACRTVPRFFSALGTGVWRWRWRLLGGAAAVILGLWAAASWQRRREGVGPIVLQVVFPRNFWEGVQPLLVTGQPGAGTFVYVRYVDQRHVRLGVDVWIRSGQVSAPIETDYFAVHTIEISEGALFPPDHPMVRALPPAVRDALRRRLRVIFDGRTVIDENVEQYNSQLADVTVGENRIGGSSAGVRFTGEVLGVRRGPIRP
jgi:hypothetical protein